jgi:hypothetical protein
MKKRFYNLSSVSPYNFPLFSPVAGLLTPKREQR